MSAMSAIARAARFDAHRDARRIAARAVCSLHAELVLHPKPGLVSARDRGAHADMDAATFMRSIFALRRYFREIAAAGMRGAAFDELRRLGIAAEARMLRATRMSIPIAAPSSASGFSPPPRDAPLRRATLRRRMRRCATRSKPGATT